MKFFIFTLTVALSLFAQDYSNNSYNTKIDMHGGKHSSLGGYSGGDFRPFGTNMSSFLDKNVTQNVKEKKLKTTK